MTVTSQAADLLMQARRSRALLPALPEAQRLRDAQAAYEIQEAFIVRLCTDYATRAVGYKVGCTSQAAQQLLQADGPFYGRLLQAFVHPSPARLRADQHTLRIIEPEFAFRMAADLPPTGTSYSQSQVAAAVETLLPAIEIVGSRYQDWLAVGAWSLIADNGVNEAWVQGPAYRGDWRAIDLPNHNMAFSVNGKVVRHGRGDAVLGNPLNALVWLANALAAQGKGLRAGDLVSTGVCCQVYKAEPGDRMRADFGVLGVVDLELIA